MKLDLDKITRLELENANILDEKEHIVKALKEENVINYYSTEDMSIIMTYKKNK